MSPEKLQLLMHNLDKLQLAAEDAAKECGMPDSVLSPFFLRPMPAADWLLELAKKSQPKNPGLLNFMTENMPQPEGILKEAFRHSEDAKAGAKGKRGKRAGAEAA